MKSTIDNSKHTKPDYRVISWLGSITERTLCCD